MFGNIATQPGGTPSFITGNDSTFSPQTPGQVSGPANPADYGMQPQGPQMGFGMPAQGYDDADYGIQDTMQREVQQPNNMPEPGMPSQQGMPAQQGGPGMGGLFNNLFGSLFGQGNQPAPQPMPMRQPNFRPDTRAPGGGGMDYNGNPVGGGMGAQFNFGGPQLRGGPAYGDRPNPGDLYRPGLMPQPMPQPFQQRRMPAPMRPTPGPVRPATSITRPRIR